MESMKEYFTYDSDEYESTVVCKYEKKNKKVKELKEYILFVCQQEEKIEYSHLFRNDEKNFNIILEINMMSLSKDTYKCIFKSFVGNFYHHDKTILTIQAYHNTDASILIFDEHFNLYTMNDTKEYSDDMIDKIFKLLKYHEDYQKYKLFKKLESNLENKEITKGVKI